MERGGADWYPTTVTRNEIFEPTNLNIEDSVKKYRESSCDGYIASWRQSLLQCPALAALTETEREAILSEITTRMLAICKASVNAANPLGASTVPTSATTTDRSFEEVINSVFALHGIQKDLFCAPSVIQFPAPYGLGPTLTQNYIAVLDTCSCSQLTKIKAEAATTLDTVITSLAQLNAYLLSRYKDTITTALYDAMEAKCAGLKGVYCPPGSGAELLITALIGCRDTAYMYPLSTPEPLPRFLQCGFEGTKICYSCEDLKTLTASFKAEYANTSYSDAPVFTNNTILSQQDIEKNELFARYINFKTGMRYTWADYLNAISASTCDLASTQNDADKNVICRNQQPLNDTTGVFIKDTLCQLAYEQAVSKATAIYEARVKSLSTSFDEAYRARCLVNVNSELFTVTYNSSEYHFTLYYYDQAGNLVQTVPPAGVRPDYDGAFLTEVSAARQSGSYVVPGHKMKTRYLYNSLNHVVVQKTPDAGESRFWYDYLGRLVVSQNAKQKGATHQFGDAGTSYSYTVYDDLGRIIQVGQKNNGDAVTQALTRNAADHDSWLAGGTDVQITRTFYDYKFEGQQPAGFVPVNLRNRVAYTWVQDTEADPVPGYHAATFYSYDIHGNVDFLVQDYAIGVMQANNRWKTLKYQYDLISGKVNEVAYNKGQADGFYHQYTYDGENRLTDVKTSRDSVLWMHDARYEYYSHGPLARTELGDITVQGMDYAYTIQGWLKSINPSHLAKTGGNCPPDAAPSDLELNDRLEPSQYPQGASPPLYSATRSIHFNPGYTSLDGDRFETYIGPNANGTGCNADPNAVDLFDEDGDPSSPRKIFARDAFKLNLHYFEDDYKPIGVLDIKANSGLTPSQGRHDLYNGNISAMAVSIRKLATQASSPGAKYAGALLYNYQYDQLNRVRSMDAFATDGSFTPVQPQTPLSDYRETFNYDPNGNILRLTRNGTSSIYPGHQVATTAMDDLNYKYLYKKAGGFGEYIPGQADPADLEEYTNKLASVTDPVPGINYTEDIDNQNAQNYHYDEIGNLVYDESERIDEIKWTVYGKIESIEKHEAGNASAITKISYTYDASGNRISKTVTPPLGSTDPVITTWYVRDAQGNTMATYVEGDRSQNNGALTQNEVHLYGSSRLGVINCSVKCDAAGLEMQPMRSFTRGKKFFELTNHLGNVLETVTDRVLQMPASNNVDIAYTLPDVASATDYYAFGMQMAGRSFSSASYRYGFNGKENDNEVKCTGNQQDYGMRIYDPRLGKFLSVDPVTKQYTWLTPYQFASNSPILGIDLDGLEFANPMSLSKQKHPILFNTLKFAEGLSKLALGMVGVLTQAPAASHYGDKVNRNDFARQFPLLANNNIARDLILPMVTTPIELARKLKENPGDAELWGEAAGLFAILKGGSSITGMFRSKEFGLRVDLMGGEKSRYGDGWINYDRNAKSGFRDEVSNFKNHFGENSVKEIIVDNPQSAFLEDISGSLQDGGTITVRGGMANKFFKSIYNGKAAGLEGYEVLGKTEGVNNPGFKQTDGKTPVGGEINQIILRKKKS